MNDNNNTQQGFNQNGRLPNAPGQAPPPKAPAPAPQIHPQQVNPQQVNPQQIHPQQVNPQQVNPQQIHPQQVNPQQVHPQHVYPQQVQPQQGPNNKKKKSPLIFVFIGVIALIGIIAVLLIGGLIVGGVLLMKNKGDDESSATESRATVTAVAETTAERKTTAAKQESTTAATTAATAYPSIVKKYSASDITKYPLYIDAIKDNLLINGYRDSEFMYKDIWECSDVKYALYDINGDNTPELIIDAGGLDIYSIYKGNAVNLTPFWGGNMTRGIFLYDSGYISMTSMSGSQGGYTYFKYEGGNELETVDSFGFDLSDSNGSYTHNSKKISAEEYQDSVAVYGEQVSIAATPITDIADIKTYTSQSKYSIYDPSAAGSDFSFHSDEKECKVNTEATELNLRAAPSMSGEVITLLPKGATVYEYGSNYSWSYVRYTEGNKTYYGYVSKQYLAFVGENVQVVSCNKKGTINASRGEVAGFASSYIVNGGTPELIRKSLGNGWHVTAVNYCYSKDIMWYELYDTDDGDYYGWVDASFINFY